MLHVHPSVKHFAPPRCRRVIIVSLVLVTYHYAIAVVVALCRLLFSGVRALSMTFGYGWECF